MSRNIPSIPNGTEKVTDIMIMTDLIGNEEELNLLRQENQALREKEK